MYKVVSPGLQPSASNDSENRDETLNLCRGVPVRGTFYEDNSRAALHAWAGDCWLIVG